jgi:Chalcone isomerase-like
VVAMGTHLEHWSRNLRVVTLVLLLAAPGADADLFDDIPGARSIGAGEFRWFGLTIYEARLWSRHPKPTLDTALALEVTFLRDVSRATLVEMLQDEFRRLGGDKLEEEQLAKWSFEMRRAFGDVRAGQRLIGVYLPGRGCRFYVNDQLSREVLDPDFARAFFSIWLDGRTRFPKLRRALLGD